MRVFQALTEFYAIERRQVVIGFEMGVCGDPVVTGGPYPRDHPQGTAAGVFPLRRSSLNGHSRMPKNGFGSAFWGNACSGQETSADFLIFSPRRLAPSITRPGCRGAVQKITAPVSALPSRSRPIH